MKQEASAPALSSSTLMGHAPMVYTPSCAMRERRRHRRYSRARDSCAAVCRFGAHRLRAALDAPAPLPPLLPPLLCAAPSPSAMNVKGCRRLLPPRRWRQASALTRPARGRSIGNGLAWCGSASAGQGAAREHEPGGGSGCAAGGGRSMAAAGAALQAALAAALRAFFGACPSRQVHIGE